MTETNEIDDVQGINSNNINTDYIVDFTTSSAISRVSIKFLAIYIPIFWLSGLAVCIYAYEYFIRLNFVKLDRWIPTILFLPIALICMYFIFIFAVLFFSKLFLILINLIHKPKEGIFKAQIGDPDFEFWALRIEVKKLVVWLMRNCPFPWMDFIAFKWFGVDIDSSSHLQDSWTDMEFIKFGHRVMIGQAAVVMTSMVIGNYLIIKKIIFNDYALVGGVTAIAPGTVFGTDTVLGAASITMPNQVLEPGWVYAGIPARKFRPNTVERRDIIAKVDVDEGTKYDSEHEVNIDKDKKDLLKTKNNSKGE